VSSYLATFGTLFTVVAATVLAWAGGRIARWFGHPPVVGELVMGIALGPSVLGALAPGVAFTVFDPSAVRAIDHVSRYAILVFMFFVGLELDTAVLRRHARGVARIGTFSLLVPFSLGCALALCLYASQRGDVSNELAFVLFVGIAMSITAMPVLTRILADWNMVRTTIGTIAIGCAAIDDIVAWTMLGVIDGLVRGHAHGASMFAGVVAYLVVMLFVIRPALARVAAIRTRAFGRVLWLVVVAGVTVGSVIATEYIGIHAVFGAFLAGACVPRYADVLEGLEKPLRVASSLVLPAFFVLIGLRTEIASLDGATSWAIAAAILVCACAGKLGGSAVAAKTLGFSWRDALAIGGLLNTRGMVELVALDLGRSLGILSPALFTMFVIMTLVTTLATVPILRRLGLRPIDPATT